VADVKKLHEKRASLLTEATSIVADLAEKGAALEGEAQVRFEALTNEASTIAAAIRSEKDAAEARSAADAARAEFAAVIAPKVEKSDSDEVAELRALGRNGGSKMFEFRDVTKSTGLGNPVTIADRVNVVAAQFNPFLDPGIITVVRVANGNNIQFPRVTALGTAGSVAEAGTITESDGTLSALSLTPVKYATIIQVSEELVEDAVFDLAGMIADKCGAEVAVAHGAFAGTAIAAAAGAGVTGSGTTVNPNYTDLAKLKASVNQVYRRAPKAGWLMNDTTLGVVTGLVDTTGQPIFRAGDANNPDRLLGAPVYSAALIDLTDDTAGSILFGDLGQIYTALVGGVRVDVSREFAWNTGLVSYKVEVRGATGLAQASAVKSFKSANVA
jgi:HK97 family phage major capsid protein